MMPDERGIESLYAFAYAMLEADKLVVALKAFRVFVRIAPTDERSWLGLGACHERFAQNDVAAELYGAGSMIASPPSVRCHLALARVTDDRELAQEQLTRASEIAESRDDDALLALVHVERGRLCLAA